MNDSAQPDIIAADWLMPMDMHPPRAIRNGGVRIGAGGGIVAVGPLDDIRQLGDRVAFFADCVLTPGLVNAHTHLDMSYWGIECGRRDAETRGPGGTGRVDEGASGRESPHAAWPFRETVATRETHAGQPLHRWVVEVMAARLAMSNEDVATASVAGALHSLASGVTTVIDVTPVWTWAAIQAALAAVPLRRVALLEVLGFADRGRQQWDEAERIIAEWRARAPLHPLRGFRVAPKQEDAGQARPLNEEGAGQARPRSICPSPSGRGQAAGCPGGAGEGCSADVGCAWPANIGLSPHAPYSTAPEVYQRCLRLAGEGNWPIMTHLSETREEIEFCRTGTGPWRELLEKRYGPMTPSPAGGGSGRGESCNSLTSGGVSGRVEEDRLSDFKFEISNWQSVTDDFSLTIPHCSPIAYMHQLGLLDYQRTLLAHVNYLETGDMELLAAGRATVVYCPRSAAHFGHRDHPWRKLLAAGVNVAIGTDSLASCPDLSIMNELRFLHERFPDVPASELFAMATRNAAIFNPRPIRERTVPTKSGPGEGDPGVGILAPGAIADLVAWPIGSTSNDPDAILRSVIESGKSPRAVFVAGQRVSCP